MGFITQIFGGITIDLTVILLVITVILVACFFLLLFEIFKLKKLLQEEKGDIKRFEEDLGNYEADIKGKKGSGKSAALESAKNYVKGSLASGMNKDQIRGVLQRRGWSNSDIDEVFREVE